VWIVDDDRSIRWVLEKALAREGIPFKTFATAYEVLQALAVSEPQVLVSDIRMPASRALAAVQDQGAASADSGHHHDGVLRSRQRRRRIPGRRFEYLPKPFDRRSRDRADQARHDRNRDRAAGDGRGQ
jgi:two-component system nitrogen regulation response regulator GlnG